MTSTVLLTIFSNKDQWSGKTVFDSAQDGRTEHINRDFLRENMGRNPWRADCSGQTVLLPLL